MLHYVDGEGKRESWGEGGGGVGICSIPILDLPHVAVGCPVFVKL